MKKDNIYRGHPVHLYVNLIVYMYVCSYLLGYYILEGDYCKMCMKYNCPPWTVLRGVNLVLQGTYTCDTRFFVTVLKLLLRTDSFIRLLKIILSNPIVTHKAG